MNWVERPVLVTGAAGFLGSWLTGELLNRRAQVVALVRDEVGASRFSGLRGRLTVVRGQLEDLALLTRLVHQYEVSTVFHLGAQALVGVALNDPISTFESNIRGSWNLLEACRRSSRVEQVVVASSDKAYGLQEAGLYTESSQLDGRYPYDVSKSCTDMLCRSYFSTYKLPVVVTRCGNFFGGGDLNFSRLVPGTIRSVLSGQAPVLRSNGEYVRDYLYVEDAVGAYLQLAEALGARPELAGEAFNFSFESPITVIELTRTILRLMERSDLKPEIQDLPEARFEIPYQMLSAEKARRELGWQAAIGLEEGLRRSIAWYRDYLSA